jgi:histidinol-phosphate aminotransferase
MTITIDESIKKIPYYPKAAMYGLEDGWVRLASNENPYPPSPDAFSCILDSLHHMNRYPGGEFELKTAIAERYGFSPNEVILGDGSDELIEVVLRAMKAEDRNGVIVSEPSFPFYAIAAAIYGYQVRKVPLKDMKVDLTTIRAAITSRTRVIFLNNPLNPTGTIFEDEPFRLFMKDLPPEILVVVDEAYAEFAESARFPDTFSYLRNHPVLVLRTFSKAYALAGLRIGYGIGEASLISFLERTKQPFSVNTFALLGAQAAFADKTYLEKVLMNNRKGKEFYHGVMKELSLDFVPTEANFIMMKIGEQAEAIVKRLFDEKILVRWMGAYGLPHYIRVSIGRPDENVRFVDSLKRML